MAILSENQLTEILSSYSKRLEIQEQALTSMFWSALFGGKTQERYRLTHEAKKEIEMLLLVNKIEMEKLYHNENSNVSNQTEQASA